MIPTVSLHESGTEHIAKHENAVCTAPRTAGLQRDSKLGGFVRLHSRILADYAFENGGVSLGAKQQRLIDFTF